MSSPDIQYESPKSIPVTKVHGDLSQQVVLITVDRLRLILVQHAGRMADSKVWVAPLGVVVSLGTTFATTEFKDFYLPATTWQAIFVLTTLASIVWLFRAIAGAAKAPSTEEVVQKIIQNSAASSDG